MAIKRDGAFRSSVKIGRGDGSSLCATTVLYLDVDGVLIRPCPGDADFDAGCELAPHAVDFMRWAVDRYDARWLTTHDASGSHEGILRAFRLALNAPSLPPEVTRLIRAIKPTKWGAIKTTGIDLGADFFWLDDWPSRGDLAVLDGHGCRDRLIRVDTTAEPDGLLRAMEELSRRNRRVRGRS